MGEDWPKIQSLWVLQPNFPADLHFYANDVLRLTLVNTNRIEDTVKTNQIESTCLTPSSSSSQDMVHVLKEAVRICGFYEGINFCLSK